ncbi:MAG: TonB-dependent receptor, partial [Terriglobus sp.]
VSGVRPTTDAAPRANTSSLVRSGSFSVNGQRSMFNNFLLDGVDNNAYGASNQGFDNQIITPPPDSVAQFNVVTNSMNAEYGRGPGATVNVATRGGTNSFHATIYEFVRNTSLNAVGYFQPTGGKKPQFNRNQFGVNFGGPLLKDKLFYFVDYEGFRQVVQPVAFASVPLFNQRAGILSVDVQDPYNGTIYTHGRSVLTSPNISPIAKQVIGYLNTLVPVASNVTTLSNDYRGSSRFTDNSDKGSVRLDWQATKKDALFLRVSDRKENAVNFPVLPLPLDGGSNGVQRILDEQALLGYTHIINNNQILDVRLALSRTKAGKASLSIGNTDFPIPGLPSNPTVAGGLPTTSISGGFSNLGRQSTNPQWQNPALLDPKVNYSWVRGKHSLKLGYEFERVWMSVQNTDPLGGSYTFAGGFSKCAAVVAGCANTAASTDTYWADFLFGAPSGYALASYFVAHLRQNQHAIHGQDDWKVNPNLTLNIGLRWEYGSPYYNLGNTVTNFDPVTATMLSAKNSGGVYDKTLIHPDLNDFAPRVGFAYAVDPKTSIRGGYGVGYIHYTRAGPGDLLAINAPQAISVAVTQTVSQASFRRMQDGFPTGLTNTFDPLKTTVISIDPHKRDGYVHSYYASVQRQLMKNTLMEVAYVGNHGLKLETISNLNQRDPSRGFARPIPTWSEITNPRNAGYGNYNSLQVRYEQRFVAGLTLLNSFTWGKSMDNDSASQDSNGPSPQDANNPRGEYAQSDYNQPVIDSLSLVYELPFGYGKTFLSQSGRLLNQVVGGWQLSTINQFASGTPFNVVYTPPSAYQVSPGLSATNRGANQYRPNRIAGVPLVMNSRVGSNRQWVNPAAVMIPNTTAATPSPFGNMGRNPGLGPSYYDTDLALNKTFGARENGLKVQFRAEAYNLFNHTNFVSPTSSSISGTVGGVGITGGTLTATFPSRILQFGLKVNY